MVKVIMFDYDGVLVDSFPVAVKAYKQISKAVNLNAYNTPEECKELFLTPYRENYKKFGLTKEQQKISEDIYHEVTNDLRKEIVLIEGIKDVLEKLSKKYKLVVASGTYRSLIEKRLEELGILHYFEFVIGNEDCVHVKPHPEVIEKCVERLGLKKEEVIYIADMAIDIQMGKSAGVKTIIMHNWSWNTKQAIINENPDVLIERPHEILEIL